MAVNPEIAAYADRINTATNDVAGDIQKILDNPANVLSDEDRALMEASVSKLEALGAERT